MKIALVHPSFRRFGGAEAMALAWLRHFALRGHEAVLLTQHPPLEPGAAGRVHRLELGGLARWIDHRPWKAAALGRDLARALPGADRVVALNYPALGWVGRALRAASSAPPVVWYCHEPSRRLYRSATDRHLLAARATAGFGAHLEQRARELRRAQRRRWRREREEDARAVRGACRIAANSRCTAGLVRSIYGREAEVLPCGVALPDGAPLQPRAPELLAVSAFSAAKNVHAAVEAFCLLAPRRPALRLTCAGEGRERETLRARLARSGLAGRADFPGRLPAEALARAYRRAQVVLYPALDEPLGLVPLEAMSFATPVVASDHGGPAETVVDGCTGFLADPLEPGVWAQRVATLLDDPALARRMGEAGRRRVTLHYDAQRCLERLCRFVEEAECASPST